MIRGLGKILSSWAASAVLVGLSTLGLSSAALAQSAGCAQINSDWSMGRTVSNGEAYGFAPDYQLVAGEQITYAVTSTGTTTIGSAVFELWADNYGTRTVQQYAQPGNELNLSGTYTVQNSNGIALYIESDPAGGSVTATASCASVPPPPVVGSVAVPPNAVYASGSALDFSVNFDKPVTVTGTPLLNITLGSATRYAQYISGSGTSSLVFRYTVLVGDLDADGISVGALITNGGTIRDGFSSDAVLTLNSVGSTAGVIVDGVAPYVGGITLTGTPAASATSLTYHVSFSESVTNVSTAAFTLAATGTATGTIAAVSGSGTGFDVIVNSISGLGTLRLNVNSGSGIKDAAGNNLASGYTAGPSHTVDPRVAQTITFANPGALNFGTTPTLTATSDSGLAVSFSSSTTGVCTITSGGALTFLTAGTCTINADQAGNSSYFAAPTVTRSFSVAAVVPGAPGIGSATAGDGQATVGFTAPASTGGAAITGYTVTSNPGGFVGAGASSPITVTGLTNGVAYSFTVTATNAAGTGPASAASNPITPAATQTITFANPGAQNFGTTPTLVATSDSGLTPTFSSSTTGVCTVTSSGALTFLTAGTCTINADQAGNASYLPATQVSRSFAVNATAPDAPTAVSATGGSSAATVSFTAPANTGGSPVLDYTVTAAPGGATATGTASPITVSGLINGVSYTFTVTARTLIGSSGASAASAPIVPGTAQTISFANPGAQRVGTPITLAATASSGLSVAFASSTAAVCTVTSAGRLTPVSAGTCIIEASQPGDADYAPAPPVQQSFAVDSPSVTVTPADGALADAMAGEGYTASFAASGQIGPVLWSVTSGTLPSGLVLNVSTGEVSGTLAAGAAGSYAFTVTATDQTGGGSDAAAVTLAVLPRAVTAEDKAVTVPAGSTPPPINLTENATGGPFTGASVVSVEPSNGGTAEIIMGMVSSITTNYPGSFYLKFTPNPQYTGSVVVRYTLQSALGTSNAAAVTIVTQANTAAVGELFSELSHDFVTTRGNLLAGSVHTPGLRDRRGLANANAPASVNVSPDGNSVTMNFASSTLQIAAFEAMDGLVAETVDTGGINFWIDGTATLHVHTGNAGDHWGSFALLSAGADMLVTKDFLVGVALYADWMEDNSAGSSMAGQGFLAGPYISAELTDGVFFDASLLYGKSWNDASTQLFSGTFGTDRLMARADLEGTWDLGGDLSFRPLASLFYLREDMGSYVVDDGAGNSALVPGLVTEQLRVGGGGSLHYVLETDGGLLVQPHLGLELGLALTDGLLGQYATVSGGIDLSGTGGWTLGLSTQADFAQNGFTSVSARARLNLRF